MSRESINKYIEYHKNNALLYEIDTHLDAAVKFSTDFNLSFEQRCFLSILTACCETTPTSLFLFDKFPSYSNGSDVYNFALKHKPAMQFQYDVRWFMYNSRLKSALDRYNAFLSSGALATFRRYNGFEPKRNLLNLKTDIRLPNFGTYTWFLFGELLKYELGLNLEEIIDPKTNHSVRSGLAQAAGIEISSSKKGTKPSDSELRALNEALLEIFYQVKRLDIQDRHKTAWSIETTLCTYNKTNHGRRYLGFYKERQNKEIRRLIEYLNSNRITTNISDWLRSYHSNWGNWNIDYEKFKLY